MSTVFNLLLSLLLVQSFLHADSLDKLLIKADRTAKKSKHRAYELYVNAYSKAKKRGSKSGIYHSLYGIASTGSAIGKNVKSYQRRFSSLLIPVYKEHRISREKLVLEFDRNIERNYYRSFTLSKNRFVVDVYSNFNRKTLRLKNKLVKSITIATYRKGLTRVVLQSDRKEDFKISVWKKRLIIEPKNRHKKQTKVITKKEEKQIYKQSKKATYDRKVIVVDAGHGGKDSGAVGYGYKEKNIVLKIAKKLEQELKKRGYKVYMTRSSDRYIRLRRRTTIANHKKADLFISIHANASPVRKSAKGVEVYFLSPARTARAKRAAAKENAFEMNEMGMDSKAMFLNLLNREKIITSNKLAIDLQKGVLDSLKNSYSGIHDGGVREGPFWVLVGAQMPAVLVEVGYISNRSESRRLQNSHYQNKIVQGMANGVDRFFINSERS